MIRLPASVLARRRAVGVVGVAVLIGTLVTTTGVAAQQDPPLPELTITVANGGVVNENVSTGKLVFTARLDKTWSADVTFGYSLDGDEQAEHEATLVEDFDYPGSSSEQVTITAGQRSATIEVKIIDDALDEHDEEGFMLAPDNPTNAVLSDDIAHYYDEEREVLRGHWVAGTIRDNDDLPELTLRDDESSTTESGRYLRYQLTLSEPSGRPVRVRYEVVPGLARNSNGDLINPSDCGSFSALDMCQAATPHDDYGEYLSSGQAWSEDNTTLEGEFVFEPGETRTAQDLSFDHSEISISVVNDTDVDVADRDETLTVRLLPDPTFEFATAEDRSTEGLILDDDLPRVRINQWGAGPEGPYATAWGVGLSRASTETVTVKYRTVHRDQNGQLIKIPGRYSSGDEGEAVCSAEPGVDADNDGTYESGDYVAVSGTLTFNAGDRFDRVRTMKLGDEIDEPVERICLEIYDQSQNALLQLEPIWYDIIYDDDPPATIIVDSPSVAENAGSLTFTVTLGTPGPDTVEFEYETADGSATAGDDYTATSGTLTFRPGESATQTVRVPISNDSLDELAETFTLRISGQQNVFVTSGTGTILDDDGPPTLSVTPATADEDAANGQIEFTVTLAGASSQLVTVAYATSVVVRDTATEGAACNTGVDYTGTFDNLEFQAGQAGSQTVSVPICDDSLYEGNETFTLTLSNAVNAEFSGQATSVTATGTIVDDELAPSFSVADATNEEDDGYVEFEVTLASQVASDVTVDYATVALTGTNRATEGTDCTVAGADYDDTSDTLTFFAGSVSETVSVPICLDDTDEEDETFRLMLSNASSSIPIARSTATGTILDSDDPPELSVAAVAPVAEDAGPMQFTVTLSTASAKTVTVRFATTDVEAEAGKDFTAPSSSARLTFAPGVTEQTIPVPIRDDSLDEEDTETFTLTLSDPTKATLQSGGETATGTIEDDDELPSLSFTRDVTASESAGTMTFTVRLSAASGRTVEVHYSTADDTASAGLDYVALTSEMLRFTAEDTEETITVQILNDALDEANETFTVELFSPFNATLSSDPLEATGTITDNDPAVDLQIQNVTVDEGGGTATFQVTLATASAQEVTVDYQTVDYQTVNDMATGGSDCNADGSDFATTSGTLTFPAQSTTPTEGDPTVTICDDSLDEPDETFGLRLRNPTNATAPTDPATGIIKDNDDPPDLLVDDPRVVEGAGNIEFTVTLVDPNDNTMEHPSGKEVTVDYATANGTATAGEDYTAKTGTLTFDPGETSQTVVVTVRDDSISEDDETFTLDLSDPENATTNVNSGTATIVDNDGDPGLRVNDIEVRENAGTVRFTVTLEPVSSSTVTVDYTTGDGTAVAGDDYTTASDTLTFDPGDKTQTVDVVILSDSVAEDDETFTLVLSSPDPSTVDLDDDTGEATITESSTGGGSTGGGGGSGGGGGGGGGGGDDDDDDDDDDGGTQVITQQASAPRIGVFLNDVVLVLGDPAREIDLVASVVGPVDTYRALAGDPRIVTVVVSGSKLALNPVALGVTTVSVSASNTRGAMFQSFRVTVIERGAPRFVSLLRDRVLFVGDPPMTVDVSPAFGGTVRSYLSTAGDPNIVGVAMTGSSLSLSGLAPGVTTVTVRANNVNGVALQSFRVTVVSRQAAGTGPPGPLQEIPTH